MVHLVARRTQRSRTLPNLGKLGKPLNAEQWLPAVKPQTSRARAAQAARDCARSTWQLVPDTEYVQEGGYFASSLLFCVGSLYFFPGRTQNYRHGCRLFDLGSIIIAVLALAQMAQMYGRRLRAREVAEQSLYFLGSVVFMLGCLISDPDLQPLCLRFGGTSLWWDLQAAKLFMVGSFLFAFAAFCNMLSIYYAPPVFPGVALTITTMYEFGGMLFVGGTMGFIPGLGCNEQMQALGCCGYLVGSLCYCVGSALSLAVRVGLKRLDKADEPTRDANVVALLREHEDALRRSSAAKDQALRGDADAELWSRYAAREADVAAALQRALKPQKSLWDVLCASGRGGERAPLLR